MAYTVYVLKSLKNGKRYVGSTSKSSSERLKEHNQGGNKWTGANGPFKLVYEEKFDGKTESLKRERFLKSGQGRKQLDSLIESDLFPGSSTVEHPAVRIGSPARKRAGEKPGEFRKP